MRTIIDLASAHNWHLLQLDVNNAFLHGFIDVELYMTPSFGYVA